MKRKETITLCPYGGLANRMRAIVSTYIYAMQNYMQVKVYWFRDPGLNAKFTDLFEPQEIDGLSIVDGNCLDSLFYNNPTRRNLFIPKVFQSIMFKNSTYNMNHDSHPRGGYASACSIVGQPTEETLHVVTNKIFHLKNDISQELTKRILNFHSYVIGFHIRRTDNVMSVKNSPTQAFIEAAKRESNTHPGCTLFLASDSQEVKREFREQFPELITNPKEAKRNSKDGIIDGLIDMYMLSKCNVVYGSFYSSFSEFAKIIGNNKLIVIKK